MTMRMYRPLTPTTTEIIEYSFYPGCPLAMKFIVASICVVGYDIYIIMKMVESVMYYRLWIACLLVKYLTLLLLIKIITFTSFSPHCKLLMVSIEHSLYKLQYRNIYRYCTTPVDFINDNIILF